MSPLTRRERIPGIEKERDRVLGRRAAPLGVKVGPHGAAVHPRRRLGPPRGAQGAQQRRVRRGHRAGLGAASREHGEQRLQHSEARGHTARNGDGDLPRDHADCSRGDYF